MAVYHEKDFVGVDVLAPNAVGVLKKSVISPKEGWQGHVMRIFEIEKGGHSPYHKHPWYHVNYVIQGQGIVHYGDQDFEVTEGSYAYIPSDIMHNFENTGDGVLKFICIVPEEGDK